MRRSSTKPTPQPIQESSSEPKKGQTAVWAAYFPLFVPIAGLITMAATILYSCTHQFTCSKVYPTLSTAAKYHPQFYIFAIGMNITSYMIFLSISLYSIYLLRTCTQSWMKPFAYVYYIFGLLTCIGLSTLATFDLKRWQTTHIIATVFFFVSSWIMMFLAQISRWVLQSCQPNDVRHHISSVRWGKFFLGFGIFLTISFGFCYVCVHGYVDNVFHITYLMEALCELFSIVCQLLFMGTLTSEVGSMRDLGRYVTFFDCGFLSFLILAVFAVEYY